MSDNIFSVNTTNQNGSSHNNEKVLLHNYDIQRTIGEGTFGKVKLAIHLPTNEQVAIKILEKLKIEDDEELLRITREIKYLKYLSHRNIIQIYEILENATTFYIIMEYATHGELFSYINEKKRLSEDEAAFFYAQIISGIEHVHKNRIAHRDLKPENILITKGNILKLIDFGLSNRYQVGGMLSTACGSPCYAAPEMILGQKYKGLLIDIWSSGVVLFAMVCGYLPFEDEHTENIYQKVLAGLNELPSHLSPGCKDLIKKLLTITPSKRILIEEIKVHLFLQSGFEKYNELINSLPESQGNTAFITASGAIGRHNENVIEKMMSMPSAYFYSSTKEQDNSKEKLKERIDQARLKKEIDSNKYGAFGMTYNLLLKQYYNNDKSSRGLERQTTSKESISNELTSAHSPHTNNNDETQIIIANQAPSNHIEINENKDINDISASNVNEEINESISTQINTHLFHNDFIASKRKEESIKPILPDTLPQEPKPHQFIIQNIVKTTDNLLCNSLCDEIDQEKERGISIEKIIQKQKADANVLLVKSALNPLHNKTKQKKYKRNNHINAYLQSVPLNKINNINAMIEIKNSIDDSKSPKYHKTFTSRGKPPPNNTINLIECTIQKKQYFFPKKKLSIQTEIIKPNKTIIDDQFNTNPIGYTNTITNITVKPQQGNVQQKHKRANSEKSPNDLLIGNNLNTTPVPKVNYKEKKGKAMKFLNQSQPNPLLFQPKTNINKNQTQPHPQSPINSQPYQTHQHKYNTNLAKRTKHLSLTDAEPLLLDNNPKDSMVSSNINFNTITLSNTNTTRYGYSNTNGNNTYANKRYQKKSFKANTSIELTKKPQMQKKEYTSRHPLDTDSSVQLQSATEGNNRHMKMIQTNRPIAASQRSPLPMKFGKNKAKPNPLKQQVDNTICHNSLVNSTQFLNLHLNPKTVIDLDNEQTETLNTIDHSKATLSQSNKDLTNLSNTSNTQRILSPPLYRHKNYKHNSSKLQSQPNKPKMCFSPLSTNKTKTIKINKYIANSSITLPNQTKSKEGRLTPATMTTQPRNVQLNIKATNNDFALCSTKSSLSDIKDKLFTLCNQSHYTIKETDSNQYIITKISRVEINNVLKLYHYQGDESKTKEMIKKVIINIGF